MPTSTVEDYLKSILLHEQPLTQGELVSMGQIGVDNIRPLFDHLARWSVERGAWSVERSRERTAS